MEVHDRLNELTATVRSAKAMPMSGSCLVTCRSASRTIGCSISSTVAFGRSAASVRSKGAGPSSD